MQHCMLCFIHFTLGGLKEVAMHKIQISTQAKEADKAIYDFSISFYVYKDGKAYIAYCPELDLSTSGTSLTNATKNFYECFQLYVECCVDKGTLVADLKSALLR